MTKLDEMIKCMKDAAILRGQLDEIAKRFVQLHNEPAGSCEADELMHVILDGEDYEKCMERILAIKKHRSR